MPTNKRPDNDALMVEQMGSNLTQMILKFRSASIGDRAILRQPLNELMSDSAAYQLRLVKEGVITSEQDLEEMKQIRAEIDRAASRQTLLLAIARTVAFVALRI